jgi:hypothetical protein
MANNLDSGFLILYEWLPMLEGLGYREFKSVLMALINMQINCDDIGAVSAQYQRAIGAVATQKAKAIVQTIGAVIERRIQGKVGGIKGSELKRMRNPTVPPTQPPTVPPSEARGDKSNIIYNTYIPSFLDISSAPAREEVAAYAATKEGRKTDPDEFFNYFHARAWRLPDGSPVRDWRAMFDVWEAKHDKRKATKGKSAPSSFDVDEMFAHALSRGYGGGDADADPCD